MMQELGPLLTFFAFVSRVAPQIVELFYSEHPELDDREIDALTPEAEKAIAEARGRIGDK